MKKTLLTLLTSGLLASFWLAMPTMSYANEEVHLDKAPINISDKASLRRGAKIFAENCYSCHSAQYMRFNRIAKDLDMSNKDVRKMMIFTRDAKGAPTKIGALMKVAMTPAYEERAFGIAVPDLTVEARARSADWLYTYLRSFYMDSSRPTGMNNVVFPKVGMPDILWKQQGLQKAVYKTVVQGDGVKAQVIDHLATVVPGTMSTAQFNKYTADLVNFMVYIAEPIQNTRRAMGWKVLGFLVIFFVFAYMLKKEYWKDVH